MKQAYCLCESSSRNEAYFFDTVKPRQIDSTLPTKDILFLQEIFLTRGLHHIVVPDVISGRVIVDKLLQSMHYHHQVTCLTNISDPQLKKTVLNIYHSLAQHCDNQNLYDEVEEFFLEQYFADFMWIELSKDLLKFPLISKALQVIRDLGIANHMPVIILSYNVYC